jgi:uncharacterized membrane protein YgdD (TMEM256/DUF423 family)
MTDESKKKGVEVVLLILGALGVGAGAFGAHALRSSLEPRMLEVWQTAVFYLLVHTLAGIFMESRLPGKSLGLLMVVGIVLFSGSLFALVLSGFGPLGAVTPFGGVLFIVAWLRAAYLVASESKNVT